MYLIVGLGNPDKQYLNTWHNMGFRCVDALADKLGISFTKGECKAVTASTKINNEKVIIAKPVTYMNLSGQAVAELCNKYKIEKGKLVVVYDDVDLPMGSLRLRQSGSAGTHNGMRNIVELLGTTDFLRIRVGIKKQTQIPLRDYVLSKVTDEDEKIILPVISSAADALADFVKGKDFSIVMQEHNVTTPNN